MITRKAFLISLPKAKNPAGAGCPGLDILHWQSFYKEDRVGPNPQTLIGIKREASPHEPPAWRNTGGDQLSELLLLTERRPTLPQVAPQEVI